MRKMVLELKVSEFPIRKVVKTDLGMRVYKRKKVHFLNEQVKEKKLLRCKRELCRQANCGLENICFQMRKSSQSTKFLIVKMIE